MKSSEPTEHESAESEDRKAERRAFAHRLRGEGIDTPAAPEVRQVASTCLTCGQPFNAPELHLFGLRIGNLHCQPCVADANRPKPAAQPDREAQWANLCPAEYRTIAEEGVTDPTRLAMECPALEKVTAWQFGARGMILAGDTGRFKTRAIWRLLRRLFTDGVKFRALSSGEFAREYADACGSFTRSAWFDALAKWPVLFVDDLGKSIWSAGVWGEFFELVETRAKHGRPILATTNEDGESLGAKARDQATWEPLYRRLKEHCEQIVL